MAGEAANGGTDVVGDTLLASLGRSATSVYTAIQFQTADQLRLTSALTVGLGSDRRLNEPTRL